MKEPLTRDEWETCDFPPLVREYLGPRASDRTERLLACGYCRLIWDHLLPGCRSAVERLEEFAEGPPILSKHRTPVYEVANQARDEVRNALKAHRTAAGAVILAADAAPSSGMLSDVYDTLTELSGLTINEAERLVLALTRDLSGDPSRPVTLSPDWRTDTAIALARTMYESREFSAMPILADALQDAGCESDDILTHCRGPGPHVRGCWVIDLVLEKE